jgi:HTH-type transcriptional regulator/antitoxin HipB
MSDLARSPKQIGNIIRRARKSKGMSQAALGDLAGLRQSTVSLIESGESDVKLDTLLAILQTLNLEFRVVPRSSGTEQDSDLEVLIG